MKLEGDNIIDVDFEVIGDNELIEIKDLQNKFIKSYIENKDKTPIKEWLNEELKLNLPDLSVDEIKSISDDIISTIELNEENIELYLEETDVKFTEGICSAPMMSSIPYELILLKLDENADVDAVKSAIKENANLKKWVCVEAEEVIVESIDNTVLFLMANEDVATPIKDAFMSLAEVK